MKNQVTPFSINITKLKKQAKLLLKLAKSQNKAVIARLTDVKPHIQTNDIKLTDIQYMLAKEHGLASWMKLKHHVSQLESSREHIAAPKNAPDADIKTLHIRCGHDIQSSLKTAHFCGDFLAYIDPVCMGPLLHFNDKEYTKYVTQWAKFAFENFINELDQNATLDETIINQLSTEAALRKAVDVYQRIVIWCEHDSYDQSILVYLLNVLGSQCNAKQIELVNIDSFPGNEPFIGLGQLPPEAIHLLWQRRQSVSNAQINLATQYWQAFLNHSPRLLVELITSETTPILSGLSSACIRMLQDLPHCRFGLGFTQLSALRILGKNKGLTIQALYRQFTDTEEHLVWLGDLMFWAMIKPLSLSEKPLIYVVEHTEQWQMQCIDITHYGLNVLSGKDRAILPSNVVAGITLTESSGWQWDHKNLASLEQFVL